MGKVRPAGVRRRSSRVDVQVFLMTALLVVLSCGIIFSVGYYLTYSNMVGELQDRAKSIHKFLEDKLDSASFSELDIRDDEQLEIYTESKRKLESTRESTGVRYLYTAKQKSDGTFIYVVDGLPSDSEDFRGVGDAIEPECIPDMERALANETVLPETIASTTWGHVFISYFPMHDDGEVVGVLGMEFDAERQYMTLRNMSVAVLVVVVFVCLAAALAAVFLFRRISNPSFQDMANTDYLTGLKNRNAFLVDLHNLERQMRRSRGSPAPALASIDLDGLKQVNDTSGHDTGDRYIQAAARLLKGCLSHPEALYRTGGDEFTVLLPDDPAGELEEMQVSLKKPREDLPGIPEVRLSVGCAVFDPARDEDLSATFRRADEEMYRQKREKKPLT